MNNKSNTVEIVLNKLYWISSDNLPEYDENKLHFNVDDVNY